MKMNTTPSHRLSAPPCHFLAIAILLLRAHCLPTWSQTGIHVSPHGRDDAVGTEAHPVQTLERAVVIAQQAQSPVTVWVAEGTHHVGKTVRLKPSGDGLEQAGLTIRGVPGGKTIVSGGAEVPNALFRPLAPPTLRERLPARARDHVLLASLAGRSDLHELFTAPPTEQKRGPYALLTRDGYTLQQARWPNRGYAYFSAVLAEGPTTRWGWDPLPYSYDNPIGGRFTAKTDGLLPGEAPIDIQGLRTEFNRTHDITVAGYLSNDWYFQFEPVGGIDDANAAVQLLGPTRYGIGNPKMGLHRRFRILNALCCLDEPGEWYYDYGERLLYLWPIRPPTEDSPVRIAGGPELITGTGLRHVVLHDLVFESFGRELSSSNVAVSRVVGGIHAFHKITGQGCPAPP